MNRITRFWFDPLLAGLFIAVLALGGCGGSDGTNGTDGTDGTDGADGADGVILADIVAINPVLDLSNTIAYNQVSGAVTIHFTLQDEDGNGIDITRDAYELRVYASELVPGLAPVPNTDPANLTGQGDAWNQLFNERGTPAAEDPDDRLPGTLTLVDATTGEYTYVCASTLAASDNVQRITVRARWRETIDGVRYVFANPVNTSYDFYQADPATELASSGADMVTTAACQTCHGARIGDVGHGGGYTQVKTCNHCHNVNYMGTRNGGEGDLAFMIHRIHDAGVFDELHGGEDFSEVTYPQHINTCAKCHTANAPNADLSQLVPTRANCGSCHDDIDFTEINPASPNHHPGGAIYNDSECLVCHGPDKFADASVYHDEATVLAKTPENISEFAVTINMPAPANGEFYVAGETPHVRVTLADGSGPVDPAVYTTPKDAEGIAGGGLSTANLYVYGPRANAVPVLTTNSTTDGGIQQAHPLFVGGTDPQVITNSNGFIYRLMDNIGDLEPGTYMVRFEGLDYDTPGTGFDPEYVTASSAVITFQVGTATEEHKLSGDACTNCHGATIMHLEGAHPHHQAFDTDGCLGCHDKSGNYGDYIGNRVHAVHSASATGDLKHREWTEVTFPQEENNCTICHTDTATDTPVWRNPNEVACGGCHGTETDPYPVTGTYLENVDPAILDKEAAAAIHMTNEGGTFDVTTLDVPRSCIVCHGEGRTADLYVTHKLNQFPPLEDPEP